MKNNSASFLFLFLVLFFSIPAQTPPQKGAPRSVINPIPYTFPAPGAIARTVQAKENEYLSVKDFGAVGNGIANDTTAIQSAINYAASSGAAEVYIPAGTYLISSTISIPAKVFVHGPRNMVTIKPQCRF